MALWGGLQVTGLAGGEGISGRSGKLNVFSAGWAPLELISPTPPMTLTPTTLERKQTG